MVAELLITTDMITSFKSCIGQKNYKHFFDKYKRTLCKDLDNFTSVILENETSIVIAQNVRNLVRYLENFNPQYPGSNVKGANGFGNVIGKIHDEMKDAILGMNWEFFYNEYIPRIDEIINEARQQKIIFVRVEHENNWYPNFSTRGNEYFILQTTDSNPTRGDPYYSKNSGEMLKSKPASSKELMTSQANLNGSHSNNSKVGNGRNDFQSVTSPFAKNLTPSANLGNPGGNEDETTHVQSKITNFTLKSGGPQHETSRQGNFSADSHTSSSRNSNIRNGTIDFSSNSSVTNSSATISNMGHNGSTNGSHYHISLHGSYGNSYNSTNYPTPPHHIAIPDDNVTSTEKEIQEISSESSVSHMKPMEEIAVSSFNHKSIIPSENQSSASLGNPINHNNQCGTKRLIQTASGTKFDAGNVSIQRADGPKGFGTVATIPVESQPHGYSIISSNTMRDTLSQYGTLPENAQRNQTNDYQTLRQLEMPNSLQESLLAPKESEAWADQALNSLRLPTPDEHHSIRDSEFENEKYDNDFFTYNADMSFLNHQADEMIEKGKNTSEELREQKESQFYAPLDPNISLESEEDNTRFNEDLEQLKAKQREELEEKRRERRKRQAELEEEMRKLRNESEERFRIFISCILLRMRFEEQEQDWMDWIQTCRNHIASLHRYFSIFKQEYHTVFGRKHQPDSDDLEEFQKERKRFYSFLIEVFNDLEDDFGKLNSIEGYSEVLFLRILQSCLANVATELLTIVNIVSNLQTDKQSFTELEEAISKLRTEKIYSTSQLRAICKTEDTSEIYQNVKFPKLNSVPIIEETY
ncbi:hypothetical protein L3Y34_006177 [Caenorhabditis briggsae]|uniref:Uncharacterized protein n=1 Tax=Caenorhabditis briggsae TaxID=6238 RepID=A0AAE8ZW05_CAEBR|nr:hypothetical protein L3Y34_006177 [Caenorhabditis briggsae]